MRPFFRLWSLNWTELSARHTICLLEAPLTLKKFISVSPNCIFRSTSHTVQLTWHIPQICPCVSCPCRCRVALRLLLVANVIPGFEMIESSRLSVWFVLLGVTFAAGSTSVNAIYPKAVPSLCLHGVLWALFTSSPLRPLHWSAAILSRLESCCWSSKALRSMY